MTNMIKCRADKCPYKKNCTRHSNVSLKSNECWYMTPPFNDKTQICSKFIEKAMDNE